MLARYELSRLEQYSSFPEANNLLNTILAGDKPEVSLLNKLYTPGEVPYIIAHLEKYYSESIPRLPVRSILDAPVGLYNAMQKISKDEFAGLHSKYLLNQLPELAELTPMFGKFSESVQKILEQYISHNLRRKCLVPAACHPFRTACLVRILGFDKPGEFQYTSAMMLHDSVEDLIFLMGKTCDHMGINSTSAFIDNYIPEELAEHVHLLTNYYGIILKYLAYLYTISDTKITQESIAHGLKNLRSNDETLQKHIIKLQKLINSVVLDEPVLQSAQWIAYKDLYISELAEASVNYSDYRIFEMKCIDIADNAGALLSLSDVDRINGIIKLGLWATKGYELHTTWIPLNNYICEIFNEAVLLARSMLLRDILSPIYKQDYFVSALEKIKRLRSVLFIRKEN